MRDEDKTKEQLINELVKLRQKIAKFEKPDIKSEQKALQESETKYKILLENLPQKIFYKDKNSIYRSCNGNYACYLKIKPDEIAGKTDYYFYPRELAEEYRIDDKRIIESGKAEDIIERYILNGQERFVHTIKTPVSNERGNVVGILGIFWDITEHKKTEEALQQSEEKYRVLFDAAPVGIGIADLEGNVLDTNENFLEITGFTLEELKSINISTTYFDPDERKLLLKTLQETGKVRNWEVRLKRRDGTIYYALLNVDLLELGGSKILLTTARDITEHKQTEKVLKAAIIKAEEETNKSNAIIEAIGDSIIIQDTNYKIIYQNKIQNKLYGGHVGEYCYKAYGDRNTICEDCPVELAFRDGKVHRAERSKVTDRGSFYFELTGSPLRDSTGKIIAGIKVIRDITEQKRAEEVQRKTNLQLQALIQTIPDAVYFKDSEGRHMVVNKAFEEFFGSRRDEVVGKTAEQLLPPDLAEYCAISDEKVKRDNKLLRFEEFLIDKNGKKMFLETIKAPLSDETGSIVGLIGVSRDITERKHAEESLRRAHDELEIRVQGRTAELEKANEAIQRWTSELEETNRILNTEIAERKRAEKLIKEQAALLDKAHDAIALWDLEHHLIYWNKGAQHLYGWTAEEIIGRNADELIYRDNKESSKHIEAQKSVIEKGEWTGELRQRTKNDKEIIVESRWTLIRDDVGKPKSILVINTDITEKKMLETQLLRAQRMESIGTLASGIAHDINNVLTPIMLSLQLLQDRFTDNESQELIEILEKSAQRGANLIKQVQSFARGIKGERIALQVVHIISEIRQITKETFPRSIEIRTDIRKDLFTISGDATQLHQVIMNICVNARDAMPHGGVLSISAKNVYIDENYVRRNIQAIVGQYVAIIISDTGTGIPPEIMERIFEPFFTTKEFGKGTGLGLSTALAIVKSHGGFIDVESKVGKGTTFMIYLPAIKTEIQNKEEMQLELLACTGRGEYILVAEDESSIRDITVSTLGTYGYKVLVAEDGAQAVELYIKNKDKIKVVLMDMMMPVMDGQESIRAIRKISPEIKIITVSGLTETDRLTKITDYSDAFLPKPYTSARLLKTIHEVLSAK